MNDILKLAYVIFAFRAEYYYMREDDFSRGMAWAYDAATTLCYHVLKGEVDNIRQYAWSDEAEALLEKFNNEVIAPWDLQELVKKKMQERA